MYCDLGPWNSFRKNRDEQDDFGFVFLAQSHGFVFLAQSHGFMLLAQSHGFVFLAQSHGFVFLAQSQKSMLSPFVTAN